MYYRSRSANLTPLLTIIGIDIALWLGSSVAPNMIPLFGLSPALVLSKPWTLVTSIFLHGSFGHIFGNMFTLYFYGRYVTELLGERRFLAIYFVGGIVGSITYVLLGPQLSLAIGASGAVFTLGGVLVVLRPQVKVIVFPIPIPVPLWVATLAGFLIVSFLPGVAWQAHLGGLVFGLAAGWWFKTRARGYH